MAHIPISKKLAFGNWELGIEALFVWWSSKHSTVLYYVVSMLNRPFPSSPEPRSCSKYKHFVMIISSAFHMNENSFSIQRLCTDSVWNRGSNELRNGLFPKPNSLCPKEAFFQCRWCISKPREKFKLKHLHASQARAVNSSLDPAYLCLRSKSRGRC